MPKKSALVVALLLAATVALAQQTRPPASSGSPAMTGPAEAQGGMVKNPDEMKFVNFPGVPDCTTGAVERGDPFSGASVILLKVAERCTVPMHFHSANEQIMIVNGTGQLQMLGQQPQAIATGGYAYLPARHPHQMSCPSGCMIYLSTDGAFDIHYVDQSGNEIATDKALSAVGEHASGGSGPMPPK